MIRGVEKVDHQVQQIEEDMPIWDELPPPNKDREYSALVELHRNGPQGMSQPQGSAGQLQY